MKETFSLCSPLADDRQKISEGVSWAEAQD